MLAGKCPLIDLPQPHPTKSVFRRARVPYWQIAKALHASEASVSRWLNGILAPPPDIDQGLNELARKIQEARFSMSNYATH